MSVQWENLPLTEHDVTFLKLIHIDPSWRNSDEPFRQSYPQYSKKAYRAVNWPHVGVWIGLAGLLCGWICVINWAIPLVVKK